MSTHLRINGQQAEALQGASLFDCAEKIGVRVPTSCFMQGKCRECLVEVESGMELLSPRTSEEEHLEGKYRLSCRTRIDGRGGEIRCHTLRRGEIHVEDGGQGRFTADQNHPFDPAVTRDGEWVLLDGRPLVRQAGPLYGLAMDLGTTTVVLRLIDLGDGARVASQSFENPQRFGGSDVMSRIHYDGRQKGRLLQRTLLGYLGHAIESFPCDPRQIFELVVAGNSTMRDLFFGLSVHSIGQKPYRSLTEHEYREGKRPGTSLSVPAKQLRLPLHPEARVLGLPLISGHVGADAAACLLAVALDHEEKTIALMDIGTNTELVVGNRHKILAASCPAGPAFEGGGIGSGMPALPGAIERVRLEEDGRVSLQVKPGAPAQGLCGSGLIDLLGELRRVGRINALGRFEGGGDRFTLDEAAGIFLNERDISQLAQAKGANMAGLHIVLDEYGIDFEHLDAFYLAGGFARHIDVDAARRIGLIPQLPDAKIHKIGNTAIEGAVIALRSASRRRDLEELVKRIGHVQLESHPDFFDYFVESCRFGPVSTNRLAEDS